MKYNNVKLITEEICKSIPQTLDISDFAKLTSHGDLKHCGLLVDQDLSLLGDFKSYIIDKNKIDEVIPSVQKIDPHKRNIDSRDTFIKPIFQISNNELSEDNNLLVEFNAPQVLLNDNYQKRLDSHLKNGKLEKINCFDLINGKNKYVVDVYSFGNVNISKVPNQVLNNNFVKGHTWFLNTKIKGVIAKIDEDTYFIPDKVLFSGVPYINLKTFVYNNIENIVRKRSIE